MRISDWSSDVCSSDLGAVAADQGDAFAGFDGQVDAFEQQRAADAVVDGVQGDQGHAHSVRGCRHQALCGRSAAAYICAASTTQPAETVMAKNMEKKKEEKNKTEKKLKEEHAAETEKQEGD